MISRRAAKSAITVAYLIRKSYVSNMNNGRKVMNLYDTLFGNAKLPSTADAITDWTC